MGHTTGRKHLKRLSAPKTWPIPRKGSKWVIKPIPGPHPIERAMPLAMWIRDYLGYAKTLKEAKYIINTGKVLVDGRKVKDYAFPVGLFDVLSFPDLKEHYRVLINKKGKLFLHKIDEKEANIKPLRIVNKRYVNGGKIQLNLFDGRNVLVDDPKKYKVGDTLIVKIPEQEILEHIPLEKGNLIYIVYGRKVGEIGKFEEIIVRKLPAPNTLVYLDKEGNRKETIPEYAVVVGKEKPVISIPEM